MRPTSLLVAALLAVAGLGGLVAAQAPPPVGAQPDWAYGFPPPGAPAGRGNAAAAPAPGGAPAAGRGADPTLLRLPGSAHAFTRGQINDFYGAADWFPDDHPTPPSVVVRGWAPNVRACGMCHLSNGKGRPENSPVAGLPYEYILQQLIDFKNDRRASAEPRKGNTRLMIEGAKAMTPDEMEAVARYYSSMKWTRWVRVVETATVPVTRIAGNVFFPIPGAGTEPIGNRIIEVPEDEELFELRDPRSGFVAYVPMGSVARGAALASGGGDGRTVPCLTCHGADLNGLGPVPGLAGRSPSYLVRQLWDFKQGTRQGAWSALMQPAVVSLDQDDMLALGAYLASLGP